MSGCDLHESGAIELYFYGETPGAERAGIERHLAACGECRRALADLRAIRAALAPSTPVAAPPAGDWSGFMARLDAAVRRTPEREHATQDTWRPRVHATLLPWLAMAALLVLVTISVLFVARTRERAAIDKQAAVPTATPAANMTTPSNGENNAAFLAMSERHFERSKLVVLGLTARDARGPSALDWAYERRLASSLLTDTRLYRLAAEQRGMAALARVMGDLELVLLQTSMSEKPDPETLEQLQRLIRKRDLVTKMEVITTAGL